MLFASFLCLFPVLIPKQWQKQNLLHSVALHKVKTTSPHSSKTIDYLYYIYAELFYNRNSHCSRYLFLHWQDNQSENHRQDINAKQAVS